MIKLLSTCKTELESPWVWFYNNQARAWPSNPVQDSFIQTVQPKHRFRNVHILSQSIYCSLDEGHNKSTSFIIPQFQQMVWTIKSQFEPIKNVIYSISRQYRSTSTSLLICHYKEQINLHPSHPMTFCPESWIFFFFTLAKLFLSSQFHSNVGAHSLFPHTNIYIYMLEEYLVFM